MSLRRLGYIDQFRGLAAIFMIETHVVNALLLDPLRSHLTFKVLDFVNGLVAPSFLFVAGFSFTLAVNRKGDAYRRFSPELFKHLRRLLFIWATGYFLHIPYFSLRKSIHESTYTNILAFTAVDILQCIAATLVLLHILRIIIKDDRKFNYVLYSLFGFFIFAAPLAGTIDFTRIFSVAFAQYFNRMYGSLFPLFPWASFLIGGTIASQFMTQLSNISDSGNVQTSALKKVLWTGIAATVIGIAFSIYQTQLLHTPHFTDYSPAWFLLRFGMLLLILYGITLYEESREATFSPTKLFGRESFLVYTAHLVIVYGSTARNASLVEKIGPTLNYIQCLGIFALLALAMYAAAYVWNNLKQRNYNLSRLVQYTFIAGFFYLFISNPY